MEPKREMSSVDLRALAQELRGYRGAIVDKVYLYGDDLVRLRLRDHDRGRIEVLIEVGETKRVHVAAPENVPEAPARPPDFARKLRNRISGAELTGVEQYGFDRILKFEFDRRDGHATLIAELFAEGNVAALDATGRVTACLNTVRLKSRTVVPGAQYEFPDARVNPLSVGYDSFVTHMKASGSDLVRTLATQLNLGGAYAEEVCTRAGVEKTRAIADAGDDEYRAIYDVLEGIADDLAAGALDPRVYSHDGQWVDVAPFPLVERRDFEAEAFETFNAALDAYFSHLAGDSGERGRGPDFDAEIAKYERIIGQQKDAIKRFADQAAATREQAELLYAKYDIVDEILSTVREARAVDRSWEEIKTRLAEGADRGIAAAEAVVDVDAAEGRVSVRLDGHVVSLDPMVGVEKNADRLYTRAKEIEDKRAGALEAIEETREELAALKNRQEAWTEGDATAEEAADAETDTDWQSEASIAVRVPEHWYDRFRWFYTADDFLVIGGRNADQNEELVRKYLDPNDRFFHAQAHGAPATILKATGPNEPAREVEFPEETLEQTAQFAVSYSSVWKEGRFSGDAYMVRPEQVTKEPESGEYVGKGSFVIRGDRTYFEDVPVGCSVGIQCESETRVIGGPPEAIAGRAETAIRVEPGEFAQGDVAKRMYREFRERFADTSFVRSVASPDEIARFLPPGTSRIVDD